MFVIVSITKFSIVIGSPQADLSRNRRAITWVSNYRCPMELFVIGYLKMDTHATCTSITRPSMASFAMFLSLLKTLRKPLQTFLLERSSHKIFFLFRDLL